MEIKIISLISLMAFTSCTWCAVPLYPFEEDRALINGANPAATVELSETYVIFGKKYTKLFVSHRD